MALDLASDLVLDVMRAADPKAATAAAQRLARLEAAAPEAGDGFAALLGGGDPRAEPPAAPGTRLEGLLLKSLIALMLPKDAAGGLQGDLARTAQAEQIAEQMAKRGTLGLAAQVAPAPQAAAVVVEPAAAPVTGSGVGGRAVFSALGPDGGVPRRMVWS